MNKKHLFLSVYFILILSLGVVFVYKPTIKPVLATVSSCTASVNPSSMGTNLTKVFTFTINNTSAQNIAWVEITRPSSDFTLQGVLLNGGFNSINELEDSKIFTNGTLFAGGYTEIMFSVISGDQEVSASDWSVTVSDDSGGANATACSGALGTEISGEVDSEEPVLSSIILSNITSSSVTISWNTDEPATSYVEYGLTDNTDLSLSDTTLDISHSFTLTGLSASTTYYFYVGNEDEVGNNAEIELANFTTAVEGSTGETVTITNTVTNTSTTTRTITPAPTPTPIPDRIAPTVTIETDLSKPFDKSPTVAGTATDPGGVVKVEYSLDGGRNFLNVDSLTQPGARSTKFEFTPPPLEDDNYKLIIRAQDGSPQFNTGVSKESWDLIIDRLAPQISGLLYSFGPHVISPQSDSSIVTIAGIPVKTTLSAVGGPVKVQIKSQNSKVKNENENSKVFELTKNTDNGLWSGSLQFNEAGEHQLFFEAVDGAGNRTGTALNKVVVAEKGKIKGGKEIENAKITVFYEEPKTKKWVKWDGKPYSQENPTKSDKTGNYSLFLPQGKFYLNITADGYQNQNTEFFEITSPTFINADFSLSKSKMLFGLGPVKLYLPDFSTLSVPFENNLPEPAGEAEAGAGSAASGTFIGSQIPYFILGNYNPDLLKGKNSVITVFNTWSPQAGEQISILNNISNNENYNFLAITEGDSTSKAYIFGKRGQYEIPIVADGEARLVVPLRLNVLPVHFFLNRFGIVTNVITGVLSESEVTSLLEAN